MSESTNRTSGMINNNSMYHDNFRRTGQKMLGSANLNEHSPS